MKKILIVDDEPDFCYFIKKNLEQTGQYEVSVCNDSTQGLAQAKKIQPDLILLDIMMPKVDGTDIASQLKSSLETKDIPFIFLTAAITQDETEKNGHFIGGECFVAKPVEIGELMGVMESLLTEEE